MWIERFDNFTVFIQHLHLLYYLKNVKNVQDWSPKLCRMCSEHFECQETRVAMTRVTQQLCVLH